MTKKYLTIYLFLTLISSLYTQEINSSIITGYWHNVNDDEFIYFKTNGKAYINGAFESHYSNDKGMIILKYGKKTKD